nr:reverse transcriptase domain-containing protein [Tanacetum cinerariifolium]
MSDQRIMAELLCAPTKGYVKAIVVPLILAEQFELKHSLINMMTSDEFFRLEKDKPHDHIRWFNKITSTIKYKDVPNSAIKLMIFPFSLAGAARRWLEKEPPCSILTWEDLVSKFINEFFSLQEQQISVMKYLIFNNGLMNHFMRHEIDTKISFVLALIIVLLNCTNLCLAAGGNTFPELRDNIQGYVVAAVVIYNQEQSYQASTQQNQVVPLSELEKLKRMNEANMKSMQTQINNRKNKLRNEMKNLIQASMSNQTNELKNMMASFSQMNTASTLGSRSLPSNTVANPKGKLKAITTQSGASINLMPLSIWKKLGLPELIFTRMTLELANRAIYTPVGIAKDVFVLVGKLTFPADFVIVDYESDPRVPLIFGRPFLRTARALIDVHGEETILRDGDERLTLNMRHDTSSYSNQPKKESINIINICDNSSEDFLENLFLTNHQSVNPTFSSHLELTSPEIKDDVFDVEGGNVLPEKLLYLDSTKDLHPLHYVNPLSGSTIYSSLNQLLEEFADELALITFPPGNDDFSFDIDSNIKEIEYLLYHDPIKDIDSILKDSNDQSKLANLNDNLANVMPKMFADEHALDYSSPSLYDEYDDLFKGEKIKESKLLIDEYDLPSDFLPSFEYDSFFSEDFSKVDALPSTNSEGMVLKP